MTQQEVFADWKKLGLGGSKNGVLHADTSTDWDSTLELCEMGLRLRADLAQFAGNRRDTPALPTANGWKYVLAAMFALQQVRVITSVLQETTARAAQFVPVLHECCRALSEEHSTGAGC